MNNEKHGTIIKVSGHMVVAKDMQDSKMYDMVEVGNLRLLGEIIRLDKDKAYIQVYDDTTGLSSGELVYPTFNPLIVELGPGLLGNIFDGVQRPLEKIELMSKNFISRGIKMNALSREKKWYFIPNVISGDMVEPGDVLGEIKEKKNIIHKVLVPVDTYGKVAKAEEGEYTLEEEVVFLEDGTKIKMYQKWPVKIPRRVKEKLGFGRPFVTGQRVFDCLFPVAEGGSASIPGGFGTGKTVTEQTLAKYSEADIIVYIGCGERGNEITDVLHEFPELSDPKGEGILMDRTILIVNTSNMPVAAREASIYTGVTIAEYYRDMGYKVALMADSISRWAEALREISSRLEEMPGEEGYPTYLSTRLSNFFERSGRVSCLGSKERIGSLTIVGAVSPPGGDFSEPVTQSAMRVSGAFWALDSSLASRRHFPAINWHRSYTLYFPLLRDWLNSRINPDWEKNREKVVMILQKEAQLQEVVQLVGPDNLQDEERLVLEISKMVRDDFLAQNAMDSIDATTSLEKQFAMLDNLLFFYEECKKVIQEGVSIQEILDLPLREDLSRQKSIPEEEFVEKTHFLKKEIIDKLDKIQKYSKVTI
ncbi:MAG: V-type ATP synthase subunit A [bacterium]|nr:V-type ATP synthase subunit A [bacterium]